MSLSDQWRERSRRYVGAVNDYVERGLRDGWEEAGEEPADDREDLAGAVLDAVRQANRARDTSQLRELYPPAWAPFLGVIREKGQSLDPMAWVDDERIVLHVGATYERGEVVEIGGGRVTVHEDVLHFGWAPDRSCLAVARGERIDVLTGWEGDQVARLRWPTGREGLPSGVDAQSEVDRHQVTQLVPFPGGKRALLACPAGIFVVSEEAALRLLPTTEAYESHFAWLREEHPNSPLSLGLSMEHGAISPKGDLVLIGSQDSKHLVLDADLAQVASIGPFGEYPHHAWFNADGTIAAFNACHFYNGASIGVEVAAIRGIDTDFHEEHSAVRMLQEGARVYAAVARGDEMIVGDAHGYLRAFDGAGKPRWQHFIGSTINAIDLSPDGRRLAVTSHAGFLCVLELDADEKDPFAIGTSSHREVERWLFWKDEPPMRW